MFPRLLLAALLALAVVHIVLALGRQRGPGRVRSGAPDSWAPFWIAGFFASAWAAGFASGLAGATMIYLRLGGRESWATSVGQAVAVWLFVEIALRRLLAVPLPAGALFG